MSLQKGLEQIEPNLRKKTREGKPKKSSKWYKLFRNRWLRRQKDPNIRLRKGYEY